MKHLNPFQETILQFFYKVVKQPIKFQLLKLYFYITDCDWLKFAFYIKTVSADLRCAD